MHSFVEASKARESFWHWEVEAFIVLAAAVREALCSWKMEENNALRAASKLAPEEEEESN